MIPAQNKTYNQKIAKDHQWAKDSIDGFINLSSFSNNGHKWLLKKYYDAYAGSLDEEDYNYILKPYGKDRPNFPSKMRNFNIIKPVVDALLGDKSKRPLNYTVIANNSDTKSIMEEEWNKIVNQNLQQQFINSLNKEGVNTGVPSQEVEPPAELRRKFETSYKDKRAIVGQQALNYIIYSNEVVEKFSDSWFDFVVSGEAYTYKGIHYDEIEYEVVNPLEIDYAKDPDNHYVEDADWVVRRKWVQPSSFIDQFGEELQEQGVDISIFDNPQGQSSNASFPYYQYGQSSNQNSFAANRLIEVIHCCWKSRKKIGILQYEDQYGQLQKMEVEEEYTPLEGQHIEWFWVNEVWEGYKVYGQYYCKMRPVITQRRSLDNPNTCKLPYNGRAYSNRNTNNISLVSLGLPYQFIYNAYRFRYELSLAKSKDMIGVIDINAKPKDWPWDKWMHYIDTMGLLVVDYAKEGIKYNPQQVANINLSMGNFIDKYETLLAGIIKEWLFLAGVSPQRLADVGSNELVGNVQQAMSSSYTITEDYFRKFRAIEKRDLLGLLDCSKLAWINGKKINLILSDLKQVYLDIHGPEYSESEFDIFISDSTKDIQKLEALRSYVQVLGQNGAATSTIAEILDNENFAELKSKIKEAEDAQNELNRQMEEMKLQNQQALEDKITAREDAKAIREDENKQLDRENKVDVATISALGFSKDTDADDDGTPDILELRNLALKERAQLFNEKVKAIELKQKDKKLEIDARKAKNTPKK